MITLEDFQKLDIRVGLIIEVHDFPEAHKPSYKLVIYFGPEIGKKQSMILSVPHYEEKERLLDKKILCIVNIHPKQIGPFVSEVLTLTVPDDNEHTILIVPEVHHATVGGKLF